MQDGGGPDPGGAPATGEFLAVRVDNNNDEEERALMLDHGTMTSGVFVCGVWGVGGGAVPAGDKQLWGEEVWV